MAKAGKWLGKLFLRLLRLAAMAGLSGQSGMNGGTMFGMVMYYQMLEDFLADPDSQGH